MKVLVVYWRGSNCTYLLRTIGIQLKMFKNLSYRIIDPCQYFDINQDDFDILIYNTFPDERHPFKFDRQLVEKTDEKFWKFKGVKILMDSFGWGDRDGFERMGERGLKLPRIKHLPSYSFMEKANVIMTCPVYVGDVIEDIPSGDRDVKVHCAFHLNGYPHNIRNKIMDVLRRNFSDVVNFNRIPSREYINFLKRTQISVNAPGDGPCSDTFYYAIKCGVLTLAEETIDTHKLLPRDTLTEGRDYVSFSIDSLTDKLGYLIKNPDECKQIRESGHKKLREGYNIEKSAVDLYSTLKNLC
jgi:hypothetical protein